MSTAFIITGQMRTFKHLHKNQNWQVFRHFADPHFFVSVANDEQAKDAELYKQYGETFIEYVDQPEHIPLPNGCPTEESWVKDQNFMHEPYSISVSPQAVLKQLWALQRGWEFMRETHKVFDFDWVVRIRPDLHFFYFHPNALPIKADPWAAFTPWWGRFGGVNDRFAVLGGSAACLYFNTFTMLQDSIDAGAALHPESLVRYQLEDKCNLNDRFPVSFATLRMDGSMRMPEVSADDLARGY